MKSFNYLAAAMAIAAQCAGAITDNELTPEKLAADIKKEDLERNLQDLSDIAQRHGGNRAAGLPGHAASSDYVLERAQKQSGADLDVWTQSFNFTFHETRAFRVTGPDGEAVDDAVSMAYNAATPTPDGITAPLVDSPVDDARGSLCYADQWPADLDAAGKVVLVKRGGCSLATKLRLAKAHGAVGAIVWHNLPGTPTPASLRAANQGQIVPMGAVRQEVGQAWAARLAAGERLTVGLLVDGVFETRETWNVLAETREGSPEHVVMLGAHLDSVQAGPGINDDGSGVSALLELMTALRRYRGFPHKVRFAWWGAEESGLAGSRHYTSTLPAPDADRIRFYFNYDMVASPAPVFAVWRDDARPGEAVGARRLHDHLAAAGRAPVFRPWHLSSDHVGFRELGIPASGLHTGAGLPHDPCYHLGCDTLANIDGAALADNARAAASALAALALSLDGVPPRAATSPNPRSRRAVRAALSSWALAAEAAESGRACSHGTENTW